MAPPPWTRGLDLRLAPPAAAIAPYLESRRAWLETVLGGPLGEALVLHLDIRLGLLAARDLLAGAPLDRSELDLVEAMRAVVTRWSTPPGESPQILLEPSRDPDALATGSGLTWEACWLPTPVAAWLRGLARGVVSLYVPHVKFNHGLQHAWQALVLVHRDEAGPALGLLRGLVGRPRRSLRVVGGRDVPLPAIAYDWDRVVLEPGITGLVRDDFEAFLGRRAWFRARGLPYRRGYLLHGPPGNGKTSVIRVMTSHPEVAALTLDFSNRELANDALSGLFAEAGRSAPALVVLEDLDRLYGAGVTGDNRTHITLQHLLGCLDGLGSPDGVIVVATANDPTALDPAILRRPGRFDRVVPLRPPGPEMRRAYLRRLSGRTADETALDDAASRAAGFSYAQLREVWILAWQLAGRRGSDTLEARDLAESVGLIQAETQAAGGRADRRGVGFEPLPVGERP